MHPVDVLLLGLRADHPPADPPAIPIPLRQRPQVLLLAAVLLAAVLPGVLRTGSQVGSRGEPVAMRSAIDLRMIVARDGVSMRISDGGAAFVGERVYFRSAGPDGAPLRLSVAGPKGDMLLQRLSAEAAGADVRTENGLLAYEFETPGRYTFALSDEDDAAMTISIEVR